jgi:hypothetical protein
MMLCASAGLMCVALLAMAANRHIADGPPNEPPHEPQPISHQI